jgi:cobalt-zinc-cadmium efflux system outer membrane protein
MSNAVAVALTEPLDLDQLIAAALERHPALEAARWEVEAARGRLVQAGLYPNPELSYEGQNIGERGPAGNGGIHGIGVEQEFVTGGKLRLAQQVARYDLAATDWEVIQRRYEVITRIRLAWVEYAAAQEQVRILEQFVRLVGEDENGLVPLARRMEKLAGLRWELLRAEVELQTARAQLAAAQRHAEAARLALLASASLPASVSLAVPTPLPAHAPDYDWERTVAGLLERSAELRRAQLAVLRTQQEWQRIAAQNVPNFRVRLLPLYSASEDGPQLQVEVRVPLPIYDRQQGNLLAAQAELARNARLVENTRFDLTRRLADAYGRYAAARQQVQTYAEQILPRAEESLKVSRTVFQRAKPEELRSAFLGLLEGHRAWLDAQLGYLQARRELWLAVYEIAGLLQQDRVESVAP